jgi:oligoendopeptidase F
MNVLAELKFVKNRHLKRVVKFFLRIICFSESQPAIFATQNGKNGGMGEWLKPVVC